MIARSDHTSAELVNKDKQIVTRLGDQKNTKNGHKVRTSAARAKRALRVIEAFMQSRRKRTQKQGPYKAGATLKAKAVVGKIEAAMRRRG